MTTCYEVWRYFGYNRKTDAYESQELIGRDGNTGSAMFLLGRRRRGVARRCRK